MGLTSRAAEAAPYVERLVANEYVQDRLSDAVNDLRIAYARASRRSATKAAQDRKLQRRLGRAVASGSEAVFAIRTGRRRKSRSSRRVLLGGVVLIGAATAAGGPLRRMLTDRQTGPEEDLSPGQAAESPIQPTAA